MTLQRKFCLKNSNYYIQAHGSEYARNPLPPTQTNPKQTKNCFATVFFLFCFFPEAWLVASGYPWALSLDSPNIET